MVTQNELEQRVREQIETCLDITELTLGRLRTKDASPSREEIDAYWIVITSPARNSIAEFYSRVDMSHCAILVTGTEKSAAKVVHNPRVELALDRTVMKPDFTCTDEYMPTTLGGSGICICSVVVHTWKCFVRYDYLGSKSISLSGILEDIEDFKQRV